MALIIENKNMPKCCDECFALDYNGDYPRCRITNEQRGYTFDIRNRRMDKCPLREDKQKPMTITVELELLSPCNLTSQEIEKDLRMAENQIGWNYDYVIKSMKVS